MANAHRCCEAVNCDGLHFKYYVYAVNNHTHTHAHNRNGKRKLSVAMRITMHNCCKMSELENLINYN